MLMQFLRASHPFAGTAHFELLSAAPSPSSQRAPPLDRNFAGHRILAANEAVAPAETTERTTALAAVFDQSALAPKPRGLVATAPLRSTSRPPAGLIEPTDSGPVHQPARYRRRGSPTASATFASQGSLPARRRQSAGGTKSISLWECAVAAWPTREAAWRCTTRSMSALRLCLRARVEVRWLADPDDRRSNRIRRIPATDD